MEFDIVGNNTSGSSGSRDQLDTAIILPTQLWTEKASFFLMLFNYYELKIEDSLYVLQGQFFKYNVLLCKYDIENKNARPLPQIEIP